MATFASLPPELVELVLDELSLLRDGRRRPLWSAALVSRAWHQIAQPRVYTHLDLISGRRDADLWIRSPARLRYPPTSLKLHVADENGYEEGEKEKEDGGEVGAAGELDGAEDEDGREAVGSETANRQEGRLAELPPLDDPYNERRETHRTLRVCDGLRELDLLICPHNRLCWSALAQPSLVALDRLEVVFAENLQDPEDELLPTLPFHLQSLVMKAYGIEVISVDFIEAIFTSSTNTLSSLELRNTDQCIGTSFIGSISPSFHLIAANLTHLFLPMHEPELFPLLQQCAYLTSLIVPLECDPYYTKLLTALSHLPSTPTITHLAIYDFDHEDVLSFPNFPHDLLATLRLPSLTNLTHLSLSNNIGDRSQERWEAEQPALFAECEARSLKVSEYFFKLSEF